MTKYTVHLFREMRLTFVGIEAETPEAAAATVSERATEEADNIEDCEGENLSAMIDVEGDDTFSRSITVDFEAERSRKAASALLTALDYVRATLKLRHLDEATDDEVEEALSMAHSARYRLIDAKAASMRPLATTPRETVEV